MNEHKVEWKILLLHHPLADLRDFNKQDIEDFIYSEFHLMFSGHLHKREDFLRLTQDEGIFGTYAYAAFTKKEDGKIGYSILDVDIKTLDITIKKYIYDHDEHSFLPLKEMNCSLPRSEVKENQIKLLKTLKKRLKDLQEKANELFVHAKEHSANTNFIDLFVDPVLKTTPIPDTENPTQPTQRIKFTVFYKQKNYLVYGKDKTGKTSLLHKINIELLKGFNQLGEIPFYIDLNEYKAKPEQLDIVKVFSRYIEHTYEATKKIFSKYKVKFLLDNFDPSKKEILKTISDFFYQYTNCNYIIVADQTLARSFEKIDYGIDGYETLFIHDIARGEIRQLTNKWPTIPAERKDEFVEKIVEVLKQHSMPFNFWTLSIFLWIFSGKNTLNFNNNSELLELYIDDLLDRNRLASDPQNRFSYQNYKLLLSEFAHDLLTKHAETNHSMKYSQFITFTENFLKAPKRVGQTSEIARYLLDRGVLKVIDEDFITFRLNGVFEYFIAYNFIENSEFLNKIIEDDNYYLSFRNEFEIYSGFSRTEAENKQFLEKIFNKTKTICLELNQKQEKSLDVRLIGSIKEDSKLDLSYPIKVIAASGDLTPLSEEQKDVFFDEYDFNVVKDVEVKRKKLYDVSVKKFDIIERYLTINGRVFRNIENIKDADFINSIFDFILDTSCNLGFLLVEEFESSIDEREIEELEYDDLKKAIFLLLNNYLPSVVQGFIYDAIGHVNLEQIVLNKINSLNSDFKNNQYKLFILHCLLLDIDLKKYKNHIDLLIAQSKMGIIKSSVLVKLFYLLMFKSYDDDSMIAYLKEKIREVNISINPKIDMREFDKSFEKTKKLLLLKRNQD